jgi:hypothetical protein
MYVQRVKWNVEVGLGLCLPQWVVPPPLKTNGHKLQKTGKTIAFSNYWLKSIKFSNFWALRSCKKFWRQIRNPSILLHLETP